MKKPVQSSRVAAFLIGVLAYAAITGLVNVLGPLYERASGVLPLYSARVVDLSSVDLQKYLLDGGSRDVTWVTGTRVGVALWDPGEERFLVFPICEGNSLDAPLTLSLLPDEMPRQSGALMRSFPRGAHIRCRNSAAFYTEISVSRDKPGVGRIRVTSDAQGLEIDYHGSDQYLF
jgi:hypothetical protein